MRVLAPAKVNIFLRIIGRRPDGYHLLDSCMMPISLYDEVYVDAKPAHQLSIEVRCTDPAIPEGESNLAYQAAVLLSKKMQLTARISIHICKNIPAGAGLGGGSSDAAAVLKSLNTQLGLGIAPARLIELATQLGADVPFFIVCKPARVEGIGEILTPLPALPHRWFLVVVPPFRISTQWAYRRFDEVSSPSAPLLAAVAPGQWPSSLVNDLEKAVFPAYPALGVIKEKLRELGAEATTMSGSGSAVVGVFQEVRRAASALPVLAKHGKTFLVEPLSDPPVDFPG